MMYITPKPTESHFRVFISELDRRNLNMRETLGTLEKKATLAYIEILEKVNNLPTEAQFIFKDESHKDQTNFIKPLSLEEWQNHLSLLEIKFATPVIKEVVKAEAPFTQNNNTGEVMPRERLNKILEDAAKQTVNARTWSSHAIAKAAKQYQSKADFAKYDASAYQAARRLGVDFLTVICSHMKQPIRRRPPK